MGGLEGNSWAYAKNNSDFIEIQTYSGFFNCLPDPQGRTFHFANTVTDEVLGSALLEALTSSRIISPHENKIFFNFERVSDDYDKWVKSQMELYGYKTRRAMFKDMKSVAITCQNMVITMKPSHHEKLEAWSDAGLSKKDYIIILASSPLKEIGAALRLAFSRCTCP